MPTSAVEIHVPNAESVAITEDVLTVALSDGRHAISAPGMVSQIAPCNARGA
jgi:hypothetical protein